MKGGSTTLTRAALRLALLLLLLVPAAGCETKKVTIAIPGFGTGNVEGIWIWRRDESTGLYKRACRFELSDAQYGAPSEKVSYTQVCTDPGQIGMDLQARVYRPPTDPNTIVVNLWYFRYADPGQFKASAYNSLGESPLSPTSLTL